MCNEELQLCFLDSEALTAVKVVAAVQQQLPKRYGCGIVKSNLLE